MGREPSLLISSYGQAAPPFGHKPHCGGVGSHRPATPRRGSLFFEKGLGRCRARDGDSQKGAPASRGCRGRCSVGLLAAGQLIQTARVWITATIPPCAFASGRLHELTAPPGLRRQQPLGPGTAVGSRSRAWRPRGGRTWCLAYWGRERRTSPTPPATPRAPRV